MNCLSAMQGTYWLVASHCGSPAFKQEPGKSPADQELLICFLPFNGVQGWYIIPDYPLDRAEFEDMAHNGRIFAYFPGVDSAIACAETPQQVHIPFWAKHPVPDLLVTTNKKHKKNNKQQRTH